MMRKQLLLLAFVVAATITYAKPGNNDSVLKVDAASSKVVWTGKKVTGAHTGTIAIADGNLQFSGDKLTGGSFVIDMKSIKNTDLEDEGYRGKLEGHLKSDDFFGVEKYPEATLKITGVEQKSSTKYQVSGDIIIKGVTRQISFPVQVSRLSDKAVATATLTIDRSEFGIQYGSGSFFDNLGDKMIYDDFSLDISLTAQ